MEENVLLDYKRSLSSSELADFLKDISKKIRSKKITFKQTDTTLKYDLPENLNLELKVEEETKQKGLKRSIEIEIEWIEGDISQEKVVLS